MRTLVFTDFIKKTVSCCINRKTDIKKYIVMNVRIYLWH